MFNHKSIFLVTGLVLMLVIPFILLSGCNSTRVTDISNYSVGDTASKTKVKNALDNLKSYDKSYYVTNVISEANSNMQTFVEINKSDGTSYREVPVDESGNYGQVENIKGYQLVDWIDKDKTFYTVGLYGDEDNTITKAVKYPKSYGEYVYSRRYLYADKLFEGLYDFKEGDDNSINLGGEKENFHTVECKLKSNSVKDLLGVENYVLYNSVKNDNPDNKNVQKLCDYYLRDLEMDLTFSDANIIFGIKDNLLRYINLEVGGLGSRLYYSMSVIPITDEENFSYRDKPDLAKAEDYVDKDLQEDADYIASFSSYEDALKALKERANNRNNSSSDEILVEGDENANEEDSKKD